MSKMQRTKGAAGEREVCSLLSDALGAKVTRQLGQARDGGHDISLPPFRLEVKRRAHIGNLYEWMRQVQADPDLCHQTGVIMLRADGEGWLAVMRIEDWIRLAREEIVDGRTA